MDIPLNGSFCPLFPDRIGIWSVSFFLEGGNSEKNPQSKDENYQQSQPTSDTKVRNQTQATLVRSKHSLHCTILTSNSYCSLYFLYFLKTRT